VYRYHGKETEQGVSGVSGEFEVKIGMREEVPCTQCGTKKQKDWYEKCTPETSVCVTTTWQW